MRRATWITLTIVTAAAAVGIALPALAAGAPSHHSAARAAQATPSVVLINEPVSSACLRQTFTVGVFYQQNSGGGSRAYRVAVYSPSGKRVLYQHGLAPTSHWAFWKVRAILPRTYQTVYSAHWKSTKLWTKYPVTTKSHSC